MRVSIFLFATAYTSAVKPAADRGIPPIESRPAGEAFSTVPLARTRDGARKPSPGPPGGDKARTLGWSSKSPKMAKVLHPKSKSEASKHGKPFHSKQGSAKSSKAAKSAKLFKSDKSAKLFKSDKKAKSWHHVAHHEEYFYDEDLSATNAEGASPGNGEACVLPALTENMKGRPKWVQGGQVMTFFVESGVAPEAPPSKTYTDEMPTIANNDQYLLKCQERGYIPDETCYYTCADGVLDTTTYCDADPRDLCVTTRESTLSRECPLDFDSDEPWHDGKSLKAWWGEVLDKFHFAREEIFSRESPVPFYAGHGAAVLAGFGFVAQHVHPIYPDAKTLDADFVKFTGWVPGEGYEYSTDTLRGSTSAPQRGYVQMPFTEDVPHPLGPFFLPNVTGPIPDFRPRLKSVATIWNYDPCDNESKRLGFAPGCFGYHHGGVHTGSGEQVVYYPPLADGSIDLLGVCTTAETAPPIVAEALDANLGNIGDDVVERFGGFTDIHPALDSMHLCIDDDIYHPHLCSVHDLPELAGGAAYVDPGPALFMAIPKKTRKKLCARRAAAGPDLCKPTNDTDYPYPWTQYL